MTLPADQLDALTILSAFIVASLSVVIVVYELQWNHFDRKGLGRPRPRRVELKDEAAPRTLKVFVLELDYFVLAYSALVVDLSALFGAVTVQWALTLSMTTLVEFFALIILEFRSSILHITRQKYRWV
jgi:hypothetical protein